MRGGAGVADGPFAGGAVEGERVGEHHVGYFGVLGVGGFGGREEGLQRKKRSFDGEHGGPFCGKGVEANCALGLLVGVPFQGNFQKEEGIVEEGNSPSGWRHSDAILLSRISFWAEKRGNYQVIGCRLNTPHFGMECRAGL